MGSAEYCEIFAFGDGAMPRYESRQFPGKQLPFYGLGDIMPLELPEAANEDDILKICRQRCRSGHFVLIDQYTNVAGTFMLGAAMSVESGHDWAAGYRIFKAQR